MKDPMNSKNFFLAQLREEEFSLKQTFFLYG